MSTFTVNCDTPGAQIYYESTANGDIASDPTLSSTPYEGPTICNGLSSLKVRAFKEGWEESEVAEIKGHKITIESDGKAMCENAIRDSEIGNYELEGVRLYFPSNNGGPGAVIWTTYNSNNEEVDLESAGMDSINGWVADVYTMPDFDLILKVTYRSGID